MSIVRQSLVCPHKRQNPAVFLVWRVFLQFSNSKERREAGAYWCCRVVVRAFPPSLHIYAIHFFIFSALPKRKSHSSPQIIRRRIWAYNQDWKDRAICKARLLFSRRGSNCWVMLPLMVCAHRLSDREVVVFWTAISRSVVQYFMW